MELIKRNKELLFYISVSVGLAVSSLSFTVVAGLFEILTGVWIMVSVLVGGLFCWLIASCISELAGKYPSSPGVRTYLLKGLNNRLSLFFSFLYVFFVIMIGGIESYVFSIVVNEVFPTMPAPATIGVLLLLILVINLYNLDFPRSVQIILTFLLVGGILAIGLIGILSHRLSYGGLFDVAHSDNLLKLPQAAGVAIFLFVGFEWVNNLGYNEKAYKSKIPRAMRIAIILNMVMFCVFCLGVYLNVNRETIIGSSVPQVQLGVSLFGRTGSYLALFISLMAILSTFNAGVVGGARFIYMLGREKCLPSFTTRVSYSTGVPIAAILTLGALVLTCAVVIFLFDIQLEFALICSSLICFVYAFLLISLIRLKSGKITGVPESVYRSGVPVWVMKLVAGLLMVFGILGISSIPGKELFVAIGIAVCCALALFMARHYHRKNKG
jgi:amino acid transporter